MTARIAINGFGRIGRAIVRTLYEGERSQDSRLVAINKLADNRGIAHLLKYDTTHGRFAYPVGLEDDQLWIGEDPVTLLHEQEITNLP